MSDVLQFKDLVGRSTVQSGLQPLQRKGDTLADPLIQPIQFPIQRAPDPARAEAKPEAKAAPKVAEEQAAPEKTEDPIQARPEAAAAPVEVAEPVQGEEVKAAPKAPVQTPTQLKAAPAPEAAEPEPEAAVEEKPAAKATVQMRIADAPAPAPVVEEEPAEVEAKVNEAKLELGGGGDGPGDDGDPAAGDGGGTPIQAKGGGDGAVPTGPRGGGAPAPAPSTPGGGPTPSGSSAPTPPAPPSAPPPTPTPSAPSPSPSPAPSPAPSSSGSPLPEGVRGPMESSFNKDFSDVSIREDSSASKLGAQAYTQGSTITFAPGKYDPDSKEGQKLIGHELKHTEQQAAGAVKATHQAKGGQSINADPALEAEADAAGEAAAAGKAVAGTSPSGGGTQLKADAPVQAKPDGVLQLLNENEDDETEVEDDANVADKNKVVPKVEPVVEPKVEPKVEDAHDWKALRAKHKAHTAFVSEIAALTGDGVAVQKLKEVEAEEEPLAAGKKEQFYYLTAKNWMDAKPEDRLKTNPLYAVMQGVAGKWKGIGQEQRLQGVQSHLYRAVGTHGLYGANVPMDEKQLLLEKEKAKGTVPADKPTPLTGWPTRGKLNPESFDDIVYIKWLEKSRAKPALDPASLTGNLAGAGWWTPDLRLKIEPEKAPPPNETFQMICDVLSLAPEWYPEGFVTISMAFPETKWVRPTVFDGMMSPLWKQHPQDAAPMAGGGAIEVLNQQALAANKLESATAHVVSDDLSKDLRAAKTNANAWVYDQDQVAEGQVGKIQSNVMKTMEGSPDGGAHELTLWEPHNSEQKRFYWESGEQTYTDKAGLQIKGVIVVRGEVSNCRKPKGKNGEEEVSKVDDVVVDFQRTTLSNYYFALFNDAVAKQGFFAAQLTGAGDQFAFMKKHNETLKPQKIWVQVFADLYESSKVEVERGKYDERIAKDDGQRSKVTDQYWQKSGKKPPLGEGSDGTKKEAVVEPVVTPEVTPEVPPKKEPKHPEATSITFVTQKFKIKNKKAATKAEQKKEIPLVVTGTTWMKAKSAEAAAEVPAEAAVKVRRAVAQVFPDLVTNRVNDLGLDAGIDEKEIDRIAKVAAITAGYDAERFDLEILEVHAEVLRDEAADKAFATAEETGNIDKPEDPKVEASLEITADEINGKINIPIMQLGGGVVARNLNGSAKYDRKGKVLKEFSGGATIIIPIGSSQVIEVAVTDTVIARKGDGWIVKSGKGTFTCKMPIKLFTTKGYEWFIAENATGSVSVKDNDIEEISGNIDLRVKNPEGKDIFKVVVNSTFAIDKQGNIKKPLSAQVDATVLEDLELQKGFGPDKTWTAWLSKDTHAGATVTKGEFISMNGSLKAHMTDGDKTWLTFEATGDYDHAKRIANLPTAKIAVVESTMVGRIGETREIFFVKGSSLDATLVKNDLTKVWGSLDVVIKEGGKPKIGGKVAGTWEAGKGLDGTGEVTLLDDFMGEVTGGWIKVYKGSAGSAVLAKGELESIDGHAEADFTSLFRGQPLEVHLKGKAHFNWPKKKLVTAEAEAKLAKPLKLNERITITTFEGTAWVADNELTKIKGKFATTFGDEKNLPLFEGKVDGSWDAATDQVNGTASVTLKKDLDLKFGSTLTGRLYAGENEVKAVVEAGEISSITGKIKAGILEGESEIATLTAKGTYDVKNNILVDLTANSALKKSVKLLNDAVTVEKASGSITIKDNIVTKVKGSATVSAPSIKVEKAVFEFGWRNDGTQDFWSFNGSVKWVFFEEKERWLKGDLALDYKEDGTFLAKANINYQMSKGFGAKGALTIDNTMMPTIDVLQFDFTTRLAKQTELFKFESTIIKLPLRIPPVFRLSLGVDLGSSLMMRPIDLHGNFAVNNWKPGATADKQVPEFDANLDMEMGFDFELWLKANMEAAIDVLIASAGIGADAKLVLKVPIGIKPSLALHGGPKGWSGAFSLDIDVSPKLLLELSAYLFADIVFFDPWTYELGRWPIDLGELPGIKWHDSFPFGEQKEAKAPPPKKTKPPVATPDVTSKPKSVNKKADQIQDPVEKKGKPETKTATLPGGMPLGAGPLGEDPMKGNDKTKEGEKGTRTQLDDLMEAAKGLQAIDVFVKFVKTCAKYLLDLGPVVGLFMLAWDILVTGDIKMQTLVDAWNDFQRGIKAAGRLLKGMSSNQFSFTYRLGKWMSGEISGWDLIMEGDNEIVKFVNQGKHKDKSLGVDEFASMFETLCGWDNVCGDEEETAVVSLGREAGRRGFLSQAIRNVSGSVYSGADQVLWKLDGAQDTEFRELLETYKIPPGETYIMQILIKKFSEPFQKLAKKLPNMTDILYAVNVYEKQGELVAINWAKSKLPK